MLKLRALCPDVRFEFVPYKVADQKWGPEDDICDHCVEMSDHVGLFGAWDDDECDCVHPDTPYSEYVEIEEMKMAYTKVLQAFLRNDNPAWIKALLEEQVTAQWMSIYHNGAAFRFLCKEEFCHGVTDIQGAWDLLKGWGVLDLEGRDHMTFVLAFEESKKMIIDDCEVRNSLVREFRVPRPQRPKDI